MKGFDEETWIAAQWELVVSDHGSHTAAAAELLSPSCCQWRMKCKKGMLAQGRGLNSTSEIARDSGRCSSDLKTSCFDSQAKFGQDHELAAFLAVTGAMVLVEASPPGPRRVWGVGLGAAVERPRIWRGGGVRISWGLR